MNVPIQLAVAAVAAVLAVSLAATAVALPATRRERMLRILASFGAGRVTDNRHRDHTLADQLRPGVVRFVQTVGDVLAPPFVRERLTRNLDYAGNPPAWPIDRVIRARMISLILVALLGAFFAHGVFGSRGTMLGLITGAGAGLLLPGLLVRNAADKRQKELTRALPDVLDALVIGVEAGLGMDAAMAQVATMLRGPMPDEINRMLQEMRLGVPRTEALRAMSARTSVRDLKRLVTALTQAGELGISVASILREHSSDQRLRRRQRAEEQAQKVAVKLLFPVLFCLFPIIFVVVLGPAILTALRAFG